MIEYRNHLASLLSSDKKHSQLPIYVIEFATREYPRVGAVPSSAQQVMKS